MVLGECPYCHRPFEAQLLSKDEIDWSEAVKVRDFPIVAGPSGITEGGLRPFAGPPRPFGGLMWLGLDEEIRNTVTP